MDDLELPWNRWKLIFRWESRLFFFNKKKSLYKRSIKIKINVKINKKIVCVNYLKK